MNFAIQSVRTQGPLGKAPDTSSRIGVSAVSLESDELLAIAIEEPLPSVVVTRICGELDMSTAPQLSAVPDLIASLPVGSMPRRLVLDLTDLRFLAASGIDALLHLRDRTGTAAGWSQLHVVGMRPAIARVLHLTDVLTLFDVHSDVESALCGLTPTTRTREPRP